MSKENPFKINSLRDGHDFYAYVQRVSDPDGELPEHKPKQIAKLLDMSESQIQKLIEKALKRLASET